MSPQYLITSASAILMAFSIWCFVDGFRVSGVEFVGAVTYLVLAVVILFRIRYARYFAFVVLGIHIAFSLFTLYMAMAMNVPTPEEIDELAQQMKNTSTNGESSTMHVFMSESRKNI